MLRNVTGLSEPFEVRRMLREVELENVFPNNPKVVFARLSDEMEGDLVISIEDRVNKGTWHNFHVKKESVFLAIIRLYLIPDR